MNVDEEERNAVYDHLKREMADRDFWKAQALLYQKELAKVNRACSRKSWHIKVMREQMKWLERDMGLLRDRLNQQGQEKGREK